MNMWSRVLSLSILLASLAAAGAAQTQAITGTPPFGSFDGGPFDVIDLANLNVHFRIPVFSRPGRGMPFVFGLNYDSTIWQDRKSVV